MVEPDAFRDLDDVRADRLAHVRDLVDERDASHEERIRSELDHLGRCNVGSDHRCLDSPVERLDRRAILVGGSADDDPVRIEEVAHRVPLGQELRIGHVADVGEAAAFQGSTHLFTRTDRHGGLHHEDLTPLHSREVVQGRPHERQISVARIRRGRLDADEECIRVRELISVERVPDAVAVPVEHLRQIRLVERQPARLQSLDPVWHHVAHDHLVPELGEAAPGDEADPARAKNADRSRFRHDPEAYLGSGASPRAIASIVSFDNSSRIELMTQYEAPSFRSTTMWRCAPE